jgi:hypothetical protein
MGTSRQDSTRASTSFGDNLPGSRCAAYSGLVAPSSSGWLRGPIWDSACLAFCWVPFYLWFVFGLRLGAEGGQVTAFGERYDALAFAVTVVLALTFVHRHYTFVLVYGDPTAFSQRARAYVIAPLVVLGVLLATRVWGDFAIVETRTLRVTGWDLVLVTSGVWNVWHTVQQRYGILRIYAGKAGGGLEARSEANRDRLFVWSMIVLVAVLLLAFRTSTFEGHPNARQALLALRPLTSAPWFAVLALVLLAFVLVVVARWVDGERRIAISMRERVPRLVFLGSTLALFAVFVVHGPIVGYLTFGTAHAVEYVVFVHHFGERKFRARPNNRSVAALLLTRPLVVAPLLISGLGLAYLAAQPVATTDTYLTYYVGTSMLHFLYDGWIWKVRRPDVADPLGARPAPA